MQNQDSTVPVGFEEYILTAQQMYLGIIPLGAVAAVVGLAFCGLYGKAEIGAGFRLLFSFPFFFPMFIVGIIFHELIHALTWKIASGHSWNTMKFGVIWKQLTPFAHCTQPMEARAYRIGAAMPGIVLGLLPLILSLFAANSIVFWFGVIFTTAASGDLGVIYRLRSVAGDSLVQDHPSQPGCFVQSQSHF
jgi:hypothetical protein